MKKPILFILTLLVLLSGCVTTDSGTVENTETEAVDDTKAEEDKASDGIIYGSRALAEGPLLLGSIEHLTGPVMEFSLLFSIYFPLSGIVPPYSFYEPGDGTRWQIESEQLKEPVFFERALLSYDDEEKSWWYMKVEGDGFVREYEFLVDKEWQLQEMRYNEGDRVISYVPSVEGDSDLSGGPLDFDQMESESVSLETALGELQTDYLSSDSKEFWKSRKVTGQFVQALYRGEGEIILEASIIEEKSGYETIMSSY